MQFAIKSLIASMLISTMGYSQTLVFSTDNEQPCAGQRFTLTLPLNCKYQRMVRSQLSISPKPDNIMDVVDHTIGHEGVIGVTLLYNNYQGQAITIAAPYMCDGVLTGMVTKTISMSPPISIIPTIAGLDGKIYSGDVTSISAVKDGTLSTYTWQLTAVSITSGSVTPAAITNASSRETKINWPSNFVGVVDVKITATRCSSSKEYIKKVNILTPPAPFLSSSTTEPRVHCEGSVVRYRLQLANRSFSLLKAIILPSAGVAPTIFASENNTPVEWSVKWGSSGTLKVEYLVSDGSRTWSGVTSPISFIVAQLNPGKIRPIPAGIYCSGYDANLSFEITPSTNDYVWQYCTSNCVSDSPNWKNNTPSNSSFFANIQTTTSFRTKIANECGTFTSSPIFVPINPTPEISAPDKVMFSGGSFDIPASSVALSTITVTSKSFGVTGASDVTIAQGVGTTKVLATQTLTTTGQSDGIVKYLLKASNGTCAGRDSVTITVYCKPVIYSDRKAVYKGLKATLSTGIYDSYEWKTSNKTSLAKTSTFQTSVPNDYKVVVTKSGAIGESDIYTLMDQLSGVNENYIITRTPLKNFTSGVDLKSKNETDVSENLQYFDGIGRPTQNISVRNSPNGHNDLVQPVLYDQFGRELRKYLPYVSSEDNGRYQQEAVAKGQPSYYNDPSPFSESVFEKSPLNRIIKQGSFGAAWQPNNNDPSKEHVINFERRLNTAADSVIRFSYNIQTASITIESIFPPGFLYRTKTIDEDKNDVIQFVDKLDRTLCKKVKAGENLYAITYYVYDELGNLVVVIPPEGVRSLLEMEI